MGTDGWASTDPATSDVSGTTRPETVFLTGTRCTAASAAGTKSASSASDTRERAMAPGRKPATALGPPRANCDRAERFGDR